MDIKEAPLKIRLRNVLDITSKDKVEKAKRIIETQLPVSYSNSIESLSSTLYQVLTGKRSYI